MSLRKNIKLECVDNEKNTDIEELDENADILMSSCVNQKNEFKK
jgi:hypothetical protein